MAELADCPQSGCLESLNTETMPPPIAHRGPENYALATTTLVGVAKAVAALAQVRGNRISGAYRRLLSSRFFLKSSSLRVDCTPLAGTSALAIQRIALSTTRRKFGSPQFLW